MLDDTIPYILCTGNHDYGYKSSENRYSQLNSYFPPNRDSRYAELLTGMFENAAASRRSRTHGTSSRRRRARTI